MNRLFHFADQILTTADCLPPRGQKAARDLIQRNCTFSIMQGVGEHPSFVSKPYYVALEQRSPLRFGYFRSLTRKLEERLPKGGITAACWQET